MTRPSSRGPMNYTVIIPARLASTRLPRKPLADIGGAPMIVRVAQRALRAQARRVVVACDSTEIAAACQAHGVQAVLTDENHASGTDRLAQACDILQLADEECVVNVQGDEPWIEPQLIDAVAQLLSHATAATEMGTACHAITDAADINSPHVVKVVLDARGHALYFSRSLIPFNRDGHPQAPAPLRHIGIYSYRAGFLRRYAQLAPAPLELAESLEQLRALWHGYRIAVHTSAAAPAPGVDTPQDLERARQLWQAHVQTQTQT
jgi:3-deoxy-manno-octulosonate cytidylyltransferase (CMP-KDO synthetase)